MLQLQCFTNMGRDGSLMITLSVRFYCKQVSADADILCLCLIYLSGRLHKAEIEESSLFQVSCD